MSALTATGKNLSSPTNPRPLIFLLFLVFFFFFGSIGSVWALNEKQETTEVILIGRDPKVFTDAKEMLKKGPPETAESNTAQTLVELVSSLESGEMPEAENSRSGSILKSITHLTPAQYQLLRVMAATVAKKIPAGDTQAPKPELEPETKKDPKKDSPASDETKARFAQGNKKYESGDFASAADIYLGVLRTRPRHKDARNNLALAEMHMGHNTLAVFHSLILKALAPEYAGADVNLSVALERLGLSEEAYHAAKQAIEINPDWPLGLYNLAWFENSRSNYEDAFQALDQAFRHYPPYYKAGHLYALNNIESGKPPDAARTTVVPEETRKRIASVRLSKINTTDRKVTLYDGRDVVGTVQPNQTFMLSEKKEGWQAIYWPDSGIKHRYWLQAEENRVKIQEISPLVGLWISLNNRNRYTISDINGIPTVVDVDGQKVQKSQWKEGQLIWIYRSPTMNSRVSYHTTIDSLQGDRLHCRWWISSSAGQIKGTDILQKIK